MKNILAQSGLLSKAHFLFTPSSSRFGFPSTFLFLFTSLVLQHTPGAIPLLVGWLRTYIYTYPETSRDIKVISRRQTKFNTFFFLLNYCTRMKYDAKLYFQGYPGSLVPGLWSQVLSPGCGVPQSLVPGPFQGVYEVPQSLVSGLFWSWHYLHPTQTLARTGVPTTPGQEWGTPLAVSRRRTFLSFSISLLLLTNGTSRHRCHIQSLDFRHLAFCKWDISKLFLLSRPIHAKSNY